MSELKIPMLDLRPEIAELRPQIDRAIAQVLDSGQFVLGPTVQTLEKCLAAYLGARHAVGVNSGTDALIIGLRALGIGAGDQVITTPFTFIATAEAISLLGAQPVFVDIDPETFNIDPSLIEEKITAKTKAILPVHLFGHAADMDAICRIANKHGLMILEDVAQAMGGRYKDKSVGTFGKVGAFSFFPTKNLGAFGDGGLIVTNDDDIAATVRMLRVHGSVKKYYSEAIGYNSRLDALQAAILLVKLEHLDHYNQARRQAAHYYNDLLHGIAGITTPIQRQDTHHVYHQYTIRIRGGKRDRVHQGLADAGIGSMLYYAVPLHRMPVYAQLNVTLPRAQQAADQVLSIPMFPKITRPQIQTVAEAIKRCVT